METGDITSNSVEYIKTHKLDYETRLTIKNMGPPRPKLNLVQPEKSGSRTFNRRFNEKQYLYADWLCGCEKSNSFYCFKCLLFAPQIDEAWTTRGVNDIKHLSEKVKKHSANYKHINYSLEYQLLGTVNIQSQLDSAYRRSVKEHNEKVSRNRHILNRIIDCVKFCGNFELALRGHDETATSANPGIFKGLINFTAEIDNIFKQHLSSEKGVFLGTSKTIQNELLDSMLHVARNLIIKEVELADFVAIQADETTDVSGQDQMVLILRYTLGQKIYERFWGYFLLLSHTADGISSCILEQLSALKLDSYPKKLIGQSYDCASVMSGKIKGVQKIIRDKYPYAYFVHCYAHQFNLIVSKAASEHKAVKIIFANLAGISTFFSRSPKRMSVLDDVVNKRIPKGSNTRWTFHSRSVMTRVRTK
jgi:hypothetical protein